MPLMLKKVKHTGGVRVVKVVRNLFCDGSHKGTEYTPVEFIAEKTGFVAFCGCKRTKNAPRCDDSHFSIKG